METGCGRDGLPVRGQWPFSEEQLQGQISSYMFTSTLVDDVALFPGWGVLH